MDLRDRLHTAAALTVVPALVWAPAFGALMVLATAALARPVRPPRSRDAALLVGGVATLVAILHAEAWWSAAIAGAAGWLLAWTVVRLDAGASAIAARRFGFGAVGASVALAAYTLVEARSTGFAQALGATHHPNATALLALALLGGSAMAWGAGLGRRAASLVGVGAALVALALTGSRGGLVASAAMIAVLLLIVVGRGLVRARRRRAGAGLVLVGASVLLVAAQASFMAPERIAAWPSAPAPLAEAPRDGDDGDGARQAAPTALERLTSLARPLGTTGGRLAAWKLAREMIAERPLLGYGFAAIDTVYAPGSLRELEDVLVHPHSGYLALLLQGGSLLLVAVLVLLGGLCLRLVGPAVDGDVASAVLLAVMVGLFVAEMLDSVLRFGGVGGPVLVALAMTAATARERLQGAPAAR